MINFIYPNTFPIKNPDTQEIDEHASITRKYRYLSMMIMAILILPINCTKNLAALRYISMAILVVVLYTVSVEKLIITQGLRFRNPRIL